MEEFSQERLARLSGMLKRRGLILPAFEIHGGAAGLYDFGPVGGRLRNRVNQTWIDDWQSLGNIVEISCPTVTPYPVLEAMHVGRPVISTDVGIVPEVVNRKNGWIIERNRSSLRSAILEAIEKRSAIRRMGINAHNSIKGKRNGRIKAASIFEMLNSYLEEK